MESSNLITMLCWFYLPNWKKIKMILDRDSVNHKSNLENEMTTNIPIFGV